MLAAAGSAGGVGATASVTVVGGVPVAAGTVVGSGVTSLGAGGGDGRGGGVFSCGRGCDRGRHLALRGHQGSQRLGERIGGVGLGVLAPRLISLTERQAAFASAHASALRPAGLGGARRESGNEE